MRKFEGRQAWMNWRHNENPIGGKRKGGCLRKTGFIPCTTTWRTST